jgi:HK97 family phage portal protein
MGLLANALAERKSDPLAIWAEMLRAGRSSKAGPTVNLDNALKVSVLFACLRKISQGCAQVPFKLFRSVELNGLSAIQPATDHSLYDLLASKPNDWSTSYEFRETLVIHAALGNAYVFKNRIGNGKIVELILLNCPVEKVQRDDYSIVYKVTGKSGAVQEFPAEAIWHLRGPSLDGLVGMDVLSLAREALGLAIATEETHSKLHAKGVRPSGTYSVDGNLDATQYAALKKWIEQEFAGADSAGAPMILDRGAKWLQQSMTGIDAQHLETRNHQIQEVCRFMDVMPIMVGYSDKAATYASAEQMFLAHVIHTLSPWYARIEQSADINLLTKKERASGLYFKFMAAGLMRGAAKDRAEYFKAALGAGGSPAWMTQDEVRGLDELNPFGGEASLLPKPQAAPVAASNTADPQNDE